MSEEGASLSERFARTIAHLGAIPLAQFMAESNAHYYAHRDPLGATGDFITAPEISQMFGEMAGAWLADIWSRAGAPDACYVELGPGRGTLARDALRMMASAGLDPEVHLVEGSPVLRDAQAALLAGRTVRFHDDVTSLPEDRPLLVIANEFFDALPVRQLVHTEQGWREIMVAMAGERFVPVPGESTMDPAMTESIRSLPRDSIVEVNPAASAIMRDLAGRIERQGGAMLAFDYGHLAPATGSSLQAVRAHEKVDPFAMPGEADLTAHVDFAALAEAAAAAGARVDVMAMQGEFLIALGMGQRAAALVRQNPKALESVQSAFDRLVSDEGMGTLFKVIGLASSHWPKGVDPVAAQ